MGLIVCTSQHLLLDLPATGPHPRPRPEFVVHGIPRRRGRTFCGTRGSKGVRTLPAPGEGWGPVEREKGEGRGPTKVRWEGPPDPNCNRGYRGGDGSKVRRSECPTQEKVSPISLLERSVERARGRGGRTESTISLTGPSGCTTINGLWSHPNRPRLSKGLGKGGPVPRPVPSGGPGDLWGYDRRGTGEKSRTH